MILADHIIWTWVHETDHICTGTQTGAQARAQSKQSRNAAQLCKEVNPLT